MYTDGSVNTALQAAVEDLFFKYGVDIYFAGHEHSYERFVLFLQTSIRFQYIALFMSSLILSIRSAETTQFTR